MLVKEPVLLMHLTLLWVPEKRARKELCSEMARLAACEGDVPALAVDTRLFRPVELHDGVDSFLRCGLTRFTGRGSQS